MSNESETGHGSSPAAWVAVGIMLVGFAVGTFAFWFEAVWLVIASAVVVVIGPIVGWALARAGYGVGGHRVTKKVHD
jgi:multisubunit Na+/H+ antiporter MnhG subunit